MSNKKTIIVFSPLPPKENGIADYVGEQLYYLKKFFDIIAVVDNGAPYPDDLSRLAKILRLEEYFRIRKALSGFTHVYHIGNNPDHGYILPILLSKPGLVVIHDLGLHHLYDSQTLTKGSFSAYSYELRKQYGRSGKLLGDQVKDANWKGSFMPHELRLNGEIIRSASSVIVHSEYSRNEIIKEWPAQKVVVIPHHLSPKLKNYPATRRESYKKELGLPADRVVIISLGFITEAKQARAILKALSVLKAEGLKFVYVLAGTYRPDEYDVKRDISLYGLEKEVEITGFLSNEEFFSYLVATDVVVNLRYPYGGETSGTLTRALGMGRCSIVVDVGAFSEIPDDCVVKVSWSDSFHEELLRVFRGVVTSQRIRSGYESNSYDWSNERQKITSTVSKYAEVIINTKTDNDFKPRLMGRLGAEKRAYIPTKEIEQLAPKHLELLNKLIRSGCGFIWWREGMVQLPNNNLSQVLLYSEDILVAELLSVIFGYDKKQLVITGNKKSTGEYYSFSKDSFQKERYIIALMKTSALYNDPMPFIFELAWRLEVGSEALISLVIDLPFSNNSADINVRVWISCLEAAGFDLIEMCQSPNSISLHDYEKTEFPELACRVVKVSNVVERFPNEYYLNASNEVLKLLPASDNLPLSEASEPIMIVEGEVG